jgi:DNA-binding IclR family transcriptional regulator
VPAFTTTIGMALLARFDDDTVRALHPPVLHYPVTDLTMTIDDLLTQVREARAQRWTMAIGTTFPGFGAVGVAVDGMNRQQAIAFCLSYPTGTVFEEQTGDMIKSLTAHAARVGKWSDDPFWTGVAERDGLDLSDQQPRSLPDGASGRDDRVHYDVRL